MMGEQRETFQHTPCLPLGRELHEKGEVRIEKQAQIFRVPQNPFTWGTTVTHLLENIFLLQNHLESGWHKAWEKQSNSARCQPQHHLPCAARASGHPASPPAVAPAAPPSWPWESCSQGAIQPLPS